MQTFLEKFKTWKSDLDCTTDLVEQQMILDTLQSCLRYVMSSWTRNRFEIVTFGIREFASNTIRNHENILLEDFVDGYGLISSIKVEREDNDEEEDTDNNDFGEAQHDIPPEDEPISSLGVKEETLEPKPCPAQKAKRKKSSNPKKRPKKQKVPDFDQSEGNEGIEMPGSLPSDSKWNVEVVQPKEEDMKYFCTICVDDTTWTEKEPFIEHFRSKHLKLVNERWELNCDKCDKRFKRSGPKPPFSGLLLPFINHQMDTHNLERPAYCKYYRCKEHENCGVTSVSLPIIYGHIRLLDKEQGICRQPKTKIVCDICGREMLVGSLKTHLRTCTVTLSERRIFECHLCKMTFCARHTLEAHIARTHEHKKSFICTKCADQFFLRHDLVRHMWVHHKENISGKPLGTCETCGYTTIQGIMLKKHKATHLNETHICSVCHKIFKNKMRLDSHRRLVHGLPKPECRKKHPCPHCTYIAGKLSHLKRHLSRKHGGNDVNGSAGGYPEGYAPHASHISANNAMYSLPMDLPPAPAPTQQMYLGMSQPTLDPNHYILGQK